MTTTEDVIRLLREDNALLRATVVGFAGRIAAAHEVIARNAERRPKTPTQLLEEWADVDAYRAIEVNLHFVELTYYPGPRKPTGVVVFACPDGDHETGVGENSFFAGTDEEPATLDQMILFALAKWRELYGTKEGA